MSNKKSREVLLLVEDDPGDVRLFRELFTESGSRDVELKHVDCLNDAATYLAEYAVDIVLLDLGLSDVQGVETVRRAPMIISPMTSMFRTATEHRKLGQ